jgi:hypothetical protein
MNVSPDYHNKKMNMKNKYQKYKKLLLISSFILFSMIRVPTSWAHSPENDEPEYQLDDVFYDIVRDDQRQALQGFLQKRRNHPDREITREEEMIQLQRIFDREQIQEYMNILDRRGQAALFQNQDVFNYIDTTFLGDCSFRFYPELATGNDNESCPENYTGDSAEVIDEDDPCADSTSPVAPGEEVDCPELPTDDDTDELTEGPCDFLIGLDEAQIQLLPFTDTDGDGISDVDECLGEETNPGDPDSDNDFCSDNFEIAMGMDPNNPDTDGDGWHDCSNTIWILKLLSIEVVDARREINGDDLYIISDGVRFPQNEWNGAHIHIDEGDTHTFDEELSVATRVLDGGESYELTPIEIIMMEHGDSAFDNSVTHLWHLDRELATTNIQLSNFEDNDIIERTFSGGSWPNRFEYTVRFLVRKGHWIDPSPTSANADLDTDAILDGEEFKLARRFGGTAMPTRPDIFLEIDHMPRMNMTEWPIYMARTEYHRFGIAFNAFLDDEISDSWCMNRTVHMNTFLNDFNTDNNLHFYDALFDHRIGPVHYGLVVHKFWRDDIAGLSLDNMIIMNRKSGSSINNRAHVLIHEMGHQIGLNDTSFEGVDEYWNLSYDSSMNYAFTFKSVKYSDDASNTFDFDDWEFVRDNLDFKRFSDFGARENEFTDWSNPDVCNAYN